MVIIVKDTKRYQLGRTRSKRHKVIEEAAGFFVKDLLGEYKEDHAIIVTIKLVEDLYKKYSTKAIIEMIEDGTDEDDWEFVIKVDSSMKDYPLLVSLAHEFVHLVQYYTGDMIEFDYNITQWQGKLYDLRKTKYWYRPWEIEAYGREVGLVERFVSKFKYSQADWYLRDPDYL